MLTDILSALFILLVVFRAISGILKARKTYWVEALIRMVFTLLAAALSLFLASLLSSLAAEPLANLITNFTAGTELEGIIEDVPSALHIAATAITVVLTPFVFTLVFSILNAILCSILARPVCKLVLKIVGAIKKEDLIEDKYSPYFDRHYRKFSILALPFCVVISVASFIISTIPYVNSLYLVAVTAQSIESEEELVDEVATAITDNVGTVTVMSLGGDKIYDALTHFTIDGHQISLMDEAKFVSDFVNGTLLLTDPDADPDEMADSLREAKESIKATSIIPMLASDIVNAAGEDWLDGRDFHGIEPPSIGEDFDEIIITFIECTQGSTCETMREDIGTLIELLAVIAENGIISSEETAINVSDLVENEEFIADISYALLENERLSPLVGSILDVSIQMIATSFGIPNDKAAALTEFYDHQELVANGTIITLDDMYIDHVASSDPKSESVAIASMVKSLGNLVFVDSEDGTNEIIAFISNLGPLFDSISESELMGEQSAKELLTAILQSNEVRSSTGLDILEATDIAVSITNAVDNGSTYTKQLGSLANVLDMLTQVNQITSQFTDPETGEVIEITEDTIITDELVDEIITNITPETVEALKPLVPEVSEVSDMQKDNLLDIANDKWQQQQANAESNLTDDEFLDVVSSIASMIDVQIAVGPNGDIVIVNP